MLGLIWERATVVQGAKSVAEECDYMPGENADMLEEHSYIKAILLVAITVAWKPICKATFEVHKINLRYIVVATSEL